MKGRQNKMPKPEIFTKPTYCFLLIISIVTANPNSTKHKLMAYVEDHDMKKRYCTHPAIRVTILFKPRGRPAFLPKKFTAITKTTAVIMSKAKTALYASPPDSFKKGIIASENPGGNICCVSKTGVFRSWVKYLVTPIPFPCIKFSA